MTDPAWGSAKKSIDYMRFCGRGAVADSRTSITYQAMQTATGVKWFDTGTYYAPNLSAEEKQTIVQEVTSMVDVQLLPVIGEGLMESKNCVKSIIHSIDRKLGDKTVNLASAVKVLCGDYSATKETTYTEKISANPIASCKRMVEILNGANKTTGYNDSTITSAGQRLCNGYAEETPLYSFGDLSDLHLQYATGHDDFQRALTYLKDKVSFTCVCNDLVAHATEE